MDRYALYTYFHKAIQEAIRQFGEYAYFDKGPREVMDLDDLGERLLAAPPADAAYVLDTLALTDEGRALVSALFHQVQDGPDEWFNAVLLLLNDNTAHCFS